MASTQIPGSDKTGSFTPDQNGANQNFMANLGDSERWASLLGGSALAVYGLTRRSPLGVALAAVGGDFVMRGATGNSLIYQALGINRNGKDGAIRVEKTVTIDRPANELYQFWRDFTNLPRFMEHLEAVTVQNGNRSHWVAKGPLDTRIEWDAELTEDQENQLIAWRSLPGAMVENNGRVSFSAAPGGRGTEVKVIMDYKPPLGSAGAMVAKFTGEEPNQQVREDLRHFKMLIETGQVITTKGQPSCRGNG